MFSPDLKKADWYLIVSFFSLFAPLILFIFRSFDDNRLTSWYWVFSNTSVTWFFLFLVCSVILAYVFSKTAIYEFKPLFLFLSSFAAGALFWREPEVIIDASRYFTQAKLLAIHGIGYFFSEWGREIFAWTDLPLVPFCYGLIFKYLGESRVYIQIFTTFLFSSTVILIYLLGKTLWDEELGFYAGLLLLGFPYLLVQVPLMLVDVPTMFFLLLAVYVFTKAIKNGGPILIVFSAASLFLAFFAKYSTWLFLSEMVIIFIVTLQPVPRLSLMSLKRGSAILFLFLLFIGVAFLLQHEIITEQIRFLISYQKPGLKRWGESFASTFLFQTHLFITAGVAYSFYCALRRKDYRYLIISWFLILIIFLQVKRIRYTLPIFPMLALMASYSMREIQHRETRRFLVFCIVNTSLTIALLAYLPFLQKMSAVNIKHAGAFLNSIDVDHIEVVALPQERLIVNPAVSVPLIDLFTNKKIVYGEYDPDLPPEGFKESPLRFTWEYHTPLFYEPNRKNQSKGAFVVIAGRPDQPLPLPVNERVKQYRDSFVFEHGTGIFLYKTFVRVYY